MDRQHAFFYVSSSEGGPFLNEINCTSLLLPHVLSPICKLHTSATCWFVKISNHNGNIWHSSCSASLQLRYWYVPLRKIVTSHLVTIFGTTALWCNRTALCMDQTLTLSRILLAPLWCALQVWTAEPTPSPAASLHYCFWQSLCIAKVPVFSCELPVPSGTHNHIHNKPSSIPGIIICCIFVKIFLL